MDFRKILSPEEGSKPPDTAADRESSHSVGDQHGRNGRLESREHEQHSESQVRLEPAPALVQQTLQPRPSVPPRLPPISNVTQQPTYVHQEFYYPAPQATTEMSEDAQQNSSRSAARSRKRARDDDDDEEEDEELTPDAPSKKQSKWTEEENRKIVRLRGSGEKWEKISEQLPGRSAISCRLHYQNFLEKRPEWDEEKLNRLARLYER